MSEGPNPYDSHLLLILFRELGSLQPSEESGMLEVEYDLEGLLISKIDQVVQTCIKNAVPDSSNTRKTLPIQYYHNIDDHQPLVAAFSFINWKDSYGILPSNITEELGKNGMSRAECSIFRPLDVGQGGHPLRSQKLQILIGVALTPNSSSETAFNDWYTDEHIPLLKKVSGWLSSARYILEATSTPTPRYLAIHSWENAAAFETEEYKIATSTPWREEVMNNVVQRERFDLKKLER